MCPSPLKITTLNLCRYLFIKAGSELCKFVIVAQVSEIAPGLYVQYVNIEITHVSWSYYKNQKVEYLNLFN